MNSRRRSTLQELFSLRRFGIKPGLERIRKVLSLLDNPQTRFPAIHVAGTNGKGSVCAMLEAILSQAGLKTGFYSSPHLISLTERFRINSAACQLDEVLNIYGTIKKKFRQI